MRRREREAYDLARGFLLAGYDFDQVVARVRHTFDLDDRKARKAVRRALAPPTHRRSSSAWDLYLGPDAGSFAGGESWSGGGGDGGSFGGF